MSTSREIMIVAGELSGDMHAARLVRALRKRDPDLHFFGVGGGEMRAAGVEILCDAELMAVAGITEVIRKLPFYRSTFRRLLKQICERRPLACILVDFPGFNLRLAERAHRLGTKTIYYICPQVWAWNRRRIPRIAAAVDRLITIFPFERQLFEGTGLQVDFVGHPVVDLVREEMTREPVTLPWQGEPRIALLPGSRDHEIRRILPVMWQAGRLLENQHPDASFIIAAPSPGMERLINHTLAHCGNGPSRSRIVTGHPRQVLSQARCALVASGTATLEASLLRCPLVVVYRLSLLSYLLGKLLVRVPHISLVNIVAGKSVCPELIQRAATPQALAEKLAPLVNDSPERAAMLRELEAVNRILGEGGASERAAEKVLEEIIPQ
ncbi:MAG: lipid-A-disaccharide synthase [Kiritimatiellae bacterium]|nr:lipid-A-disaccharide synthase [Kiritimatiellia bacterium]